MVSENDMADEADITAGAPVDTDTSDTAPQSEQALVKEVISRIKSDKAHHAAAFKRMREDQRTAMWGADDTWADENYRANIVGRHVKMKTAALYAKDPKATAKRKEKLDFTVWDESPATLQLAYVTLQNAQMQQAPVDPLTGAPAAPAAIPALAEAVAQAQATIADFTQGLQRRQIAERFGKTLELVFAHQLTEQQPLDFKRAMKATVRRALTNGVAYVELGFQREYGPAPITGARLNDNRTRLEHLQRLASEAAEGEVDPDDPEVAELQASIASLMAEPEVIVREGLVIDHPLSTRVIPDKMTTRLVGFVGARWVTLEYAYTTDQVKETFGVDIAGSYAPYSLDADRSKDVGFTSIGNDARRPGDKGHRDNLVCVWKHYDKVANLVYYVADGHSSFLRPPAAPDVFVEGFWPVYALTFNEVENERELFPPSDVRLLRDMQREYNRSRQGKREHRLAARPKWAAPAGVLPDDDIQALKGLQPFQLLKLNMDPQTRIGDILQTVPVPGVDPNLYDVGEIFNDMQLVGGAQEAQYGGVSKSTATESAIAANATTASDSSAIDDLDGFLSALAHDAGQILKREMSLEQVVKIAGPGAVWPDQTMQEIVDDVALVVAAGSTGKPNQAVEINNWKQMLPYLMQMPNIDPVWLAREALRRLDDRLDLTAAIASGIPSIAMQNQAKANPQNAAAGPNAPEQQGPQGAANAPKPAQEGGSPAAFGSNQV